MEKAEKRGKCQRAFIRMMDYHQPGRAVSHAEQYEFQVIRETLSSLYDKNSIGELLEAYRAFKAGEDLFELLTGRVSRDRSIKVFDAFDDSRTKIRIGEEFLVPEVKDIVYSCFYEYLRQAAFLCERSMELMDKAGVDLRRGIQVRKIEGLWCLEIRHRRGTEVVRGVDRCFRDAAGVYNSKGYYDTAVINRFNRELFPLFDRILDASLGITIQPLSN